MKEDRDTPDSRTWFSPSEAALHSLFDNMTDGQRPFILLSLWCLLLYATTIAALPPMDRDEARFAQASAQMLETGDYVRIRFQDKARNKKPAGIYWLQAASVSLLSSETAREIWAYRVPSALGAWIATLLTFAIGARLFERRTALLGALSLGGCMMLFVEAHLAKTDAVLLATIVGAQWALARIYLGTRDGSRPPALWAFWLWLALGLGFLIKGPVPMMVVALTAATLSIADRDGKWLKGLYPVWGVPLMLLIVLPWFVLAGQAFIADAVGKDLLPKLMSGQESHGAPPGYYLLLMTVFLFPASLYVWPALFRSWKVRLHPGIRFCLAWLIPAWIVFELIPTKLPHYVLPMYPALALLTARAALNRDLRDWGTKIGMMVWALVPVALGVAALALPVIYGDGFDLLMLIPAMIAVALLIVVLPRAWRGDSPVAMNQAMGLGVLLLITVVGLALPSLESFKGSVRVAEALPDNHGPLATAGYHEPSLVFLAGTDTKLVDGGSAAAHLLDGHGPAVVNDREQAAFDQAVGESKIAPDRVVRAFNYSRGRWELLSLYLPKGGQP
ncbi:glycosyltransferase family 39 protein [Magnetospira sp. QH-2]|uniref:ArnT family glycosyltransferase n=1 Tax=Magnetospira sp. (strain QH-2) TaxID=1288970 RepID=UPI0003E80DC6|nr:glycosyltransferase family 39 protein [Magnetospira sp. QH-2]CCQ75418.1 putative GT83 : distantly related to 4-amino-4-deoxy-L-arabinotransferase [Magnetospira sp. QH-2]